MQDKQFFWLHIKKSAGITTRALLQPYYVEVDRVRKPMTFIQASPDQYNDILNNYRVVLGDYQFKRCLFAKKYLYPDSWNNIYSFAFSREPIDRCISIFYYLYCRTAGYFWRALRSKKSVVTEKKVEVNASYAFDVFLDYAEEARLSDNIYKPFAIHFTTHTAPMWDDISDNDGNILLTEVFRLEALTKGINKAYSACGIDKVLDLSDKELNKNKNRNREKYIPTQSQILKIEKIYANDFDIYEDAWH